MYENNFRLKSLIKYCLVIVLLIVCLVIKHSVLADYKKLPSASALSNSVASSLTSSGSNSLPTPNKDFLITDTKYFNNNQWVVVTVKENNTHSDTAYEVLEKINGVYTVVLGPGTSFSQDVQEEMPTSVSDYLSLQGLF